MLSFYQVAVILLLAVSPSICSPNSTATSAPECAELCLASLLSNSSCSTFAAEIFKCGKDTCTPKELLQTINLASVKCDAAVRNQGEAYSTMSIAFISITSIFVGLRFLERLLFGSGFYVDDYMILFSFLVGIPSTVINIHGLTPNGLGRDVWMVPFDQITRFLKFLYINEVLYFTEVFTVKLCILIFYLRIFPGTAIRRLIWGTIFATVISLIVFDLVTIFQCRPIRHYWEGWDGLHQGECISVNFLTWANAAVSILLDFWMLALPLSQVIHLRLHWKKKAWVFLMFGVGSFVTAVSVLRLRFLVKFGNTVNPTWDVYDTAYWSAVELNVAVCCACMPNIRLLLVNLFPKHMGSSTRSGDRDSRTGAKNGLDLRDPTHTIIRSRGFDLGCCRHNGSQLSTVELVETGRIDAISKHSVSSDLNR
ncbi:putative integral membrane protein [Coniochaeta sp. 2T2.1]|nr:putative integral membrane protein [Coniochaeta sp. 2T2.1]